VGYLNLSLVHLLGDDSSKLRRLAATSCLERSLFNKPAGDRSGLGLIASVNIAGSEGMLLFEAEFKSNSSILRGIQSGFIDFLLYVTISLPQAACPSTNSCQVQSLR
jgi:hypothetical protein